MPITEIVYDVDDQGMFGTSSPLLVANSASGAGWLITLNDWQSRSIDPATANFVNTETGIGPDYVQEVFTGNVTINGVFQTGVTINFGIETNAPPGTINFTNMPGQGAFTILNACQTGAAWKLGGTQCGPGSVPACASPAALADDIYYILQMNGSWISSPDTVLYTVAFTPYARRVP